MPTFSSIVLQASLGPNGTNFIIATVVLLVLVAVVSVGMRSRLPKGDAKRAAYGLIAGLCVVGLLFAGLVYAAFAAGMVPG